MSEKLCHINMIRPAGADGLLELECSACLRGFSWHEQFSYPAYCFFCGAQRVVDTVKEDIQWGVKFKAVAGNLECSSCRRIFSYSNTATLDIPNFCPHCGLKHLDLRFNEISSKLQQRLRGINLTRAQADELIDAIQERV